MGYILRFRAKNLAEASSLRNFCQEPGHRASVPTAGLCRRLATSSSRSATPTGRGLLGTCSQGLLLVAFPVNTRRLIHWNADGRSGAGEEAE